MTIHSMSNWTPPQVQANLAKLVADRFGGEAPAVDEAALRSEVMQSNPIRRQNGNDNAMQCNAVQCNAMQCNAMHCTAMQCNAMQCNAMQCNAMQCNAMQCNG